MFHASSAPAPSVLITTRAQRLRSRSQRLHDPLGPPGTGKSHIAQAIGHAAIQQGHRVTYREAHVLLEDLAQATLEGTRGDRLADLALVPLLIVDDLGMRKLPASAAEDLLELVMRRYERASTILTSNRPRRRLGKASRRRGGGHRHARSPPSSRPCAQVWTAKLSNSTAPACQPTPVTSKDLSSPALAVRWPVLRRSRLAGFHPDPRGRAERPPERRVRPADEAWRKLSVALNLCRSPLLRQAERPGAPPRSRLQSPGSTVAEHQPVSQVPPPQLPAKRLFRHHIRPSVRLHRRHEPEVIDGHRRGR